MARDFKSSFLRAVFASAAQQQDMRSDSELKASARRFTVVSACAALWGRSEELW
jgi:hypothetical protein